nr:immunoglobulin light chain junction region [Macaca mulatta]
NYYCQVSDSSAVLF